MYVLKLIHHLSHPIEIQILEPSRALSILDALHSERPAEYGRLMRYKQCRIRKTDNTEFWAVLTKFDMTTIAIMVTQELESYGYDG